MFNQTTNSTKIKKQLKNSFIFKFIKFLEAQGSSVEK